MKQQIDNLIANILLDEGEVYLPQVGTLILLRHPAKLLSKKELQRPYRELRLTQEERSISITLHIAKVANVSDERASDIYAEWFTQSLRDNILTIGGVCAISGGKAKIDNQFRKLINPKGEGSIKVHPRKNNLVFAVAAVVLLAILGSVGLYLHTADTLTPCSTTAEEATTEEASTSNNEITILVEPIADSVSTPATEVIAAGETSDSTAVVAPKTDSLATIEPATEPITEPTTEVVTETTKHTIHPMTKGCSYAVWGVYKELKNADEAMEWLGEKFPQIEAKIYKYDQRYLIALCEVKSRNACGRQVSSWKRRYRSFRSVWVYTR